MGIGQDRKAQSRSRAGKRVRNLTKEGVEPNPGFSVRPPSKTGKNWEPPNPPFWAPRRGGGIASNSHVTGKRVWSINVQGVANLFRAPGKLGLRLSPSRSLILRPGNRVRHAACWRGGVIVRGPFRLGVHGLGKVGFEVVFWWQSKLTSQLISCTIRKTSRDTCSHSLSGLARLPVSLRVRRRLWHSVVVPKAVWGRGLRLPRKGDFRTGAASKPGAFCADGGAYGLSSLQGGGGGGHWIVEGYTQALCHMAAQHPTRHVGG